MRNFVDYTKRSVDLPPGCKDLMDVLKLAPPKQGKTVSGGAEVIMPTWKQLVTEEGGMDRVEAMLYRLLQDGKHDLLLITILPSLVHGCGVRPISGGLELFLTVEGSDEETAMLEFFASPQIALRPKVWTTTKGKSVLRCPPLKQPSRTAEIIRRLLTNKYSCGPSAHLRFMFM